MLTEGQIFDSYEILAQLGQGGMGSVYKARHIRMGNTVALKTLHEEVLGDTRQFERFKREARAASKLDHDTIVKPLVFSVTDGQPFIVYEYVEGETLASFLKRSESISDELIINIISQLAAALDHAHKRGVVHRDVKPSNIVIVSEDRSVRLLDFGIATVLNSTEQRLTATTHMIGTPAYMSPEQCSGKPLDGRSDLYALGCILYELLSGTPPFEGTSAFEINLKHVHDAPPEIRTNHSPILKDICTKLLRKEPASRYQSGSEVVSALLAVDGTKVNRSTKQWVHVCAALLILVTTGGLVYAFQPSNRNVSSSSSKSNEWSKVVAVDTMATLLKEKRITDAHNLFEKEIRGRPVPRRLIPLLHSLALAEFADGALTDATRDFASEVECIETKEGFDSPYMCDAIINWTQIEDLTNTTSENTYHRLLRALRIADERKPAYAMYIATLLPSVLDKLSKNPAVSKPRRAEFASLALKALTDLGQRLDRSPADPFLRLQFETLHINLTWPDEAASQKAREMHSIAAMRQLILLYEKSSANTDSYLLFLFNCLETHVKTLPSDVSEKFTRIAEQVLARQKDPGSVYQFTIHLHKLYARTDQVKALHLLKATLKSSQFKNFHPIERATIYHEIIFMNVELPLKDRLNYAQSAFDILKDDKSSGHRTAAQLLADELTRAGRYTEAVPYYKDALNCSLGVKQNTNRLVADTAIIFAESASVHHDEANVQFALHNCSFLATTADPQLLTHAEAYKKLTAKSVNVQRNEQVNRSN